MKLDLYRFGKTYSFYEQSLCSTIKHIGDLFFEITYLASEVVGCFLLKWRADVKKVVETNNG